MFPFTAPVRLSGGRLTYSGRFTRARFLAWLETPPGRAAVGAIAAHVRFTLVGRMRVARRRLWRELAAAARDGGVMAAVQRELDAYPARLGDLAFGDGLPRVVIDLRRLVVVPSVMINAAAYRGIERALRAQRAIAALEGGDRLRSFFFVTLVDEIEAAVAHAQPSPGKPLAAGDGWASVGLNRTFVWRAALLDGPEWPGHHYVLELTREPVTRAVRKRVGGHIRDFETSLASLSRLDRNEILRRANAAA
ncbi:MAG: hypothetical protein ACM3SQ_01680 [Betaproteobacteria bacterium]